MLYFNRMSRLLLRTLLFLLLLTIPALAAYLPGEMVVNFKPGVISLPQGIKATSVREASIAASSVQSLNTKYGVTELVPLYQDALALQPTWKHLENYYLVRFSPAKNVSQAVKEYQKDSNVISATPNIIVRAFDVTPNDPYYLSGQQWALSKMVAPKGWVRTTGSADLIVAILDTGVNYNHDEFSGKVDTADAKNYVADPINGNGDPLDDYGHGTAVSGIIGAIGNNGKGIAGVDWKVKILPIKVLNNRGEGNMTDINSGIAYVTALKASGKQVVAINLSLGQYSPDSNCEARCLDAYNEDLVLVAAAGNGSVDWKTYPAYYSSVMAVSATDSNDDRSVWTGIDPETGKIQASNYGDWIAVSAPGSSIFSTDKSGSYSNNWNGTSMAAPYAVGLVTLMKAANPTMSNQQIINRIKNTADNIYGDDQNPKNVGYKNKLGTGRINTYKALAGLTAQITAPSSGDYIKGTKTIFGEATGWNFTNYRLEAIQNSTLITIESSTTSVESPGILGSWDTTGLNGLFTVRLIALAQDSSSAEATVAVIVNNTTPEAMVTSPVTNETLSGKVTITGTAKDPYLENYILEYGEGSLPTSFLTIAKRWLPVDGGPLGTWETAGLSGVYTIRLTTYNKAGASKETNFAVTLSGLQLPTKEVSPVSGLPLTYVLPNPFDRTTTQETHFCYNLEGNFEVVIYLFDLNGSLIWKRSYSAGENGGKAGANDPAWDGKNLYNEQVSNGVYIYQIIADRKIIARGKIALLN